MGSNVSIKLFGQLSFTAVFTWSHCSLLRRRREGDERAVLLALPARPRVLAEKRGREGRLERLGCGEQRSRGGAGSRTRDYEEGARPQGDGADVGEPLARRVDGMRRSL